MPTKKESLMGFMFIGLLLVISAYFDEPSKEYVAYNEDSDEISLKQGE